MHFLHEEWLQEDFYEACVTMAIYKNLLSSIIEMAGDFISICQEHDFIHNIFARGIFARFYSSNFDYDISNFAELISLDLAPQFNRWEYSYLPGTRVEDEIGRSWVFL